MVDQPARIVSLDTSYEAVASSIGEARRQVAALAVADGAGQEDLERIRLAVSEALSNAVLHGYGGQEAGLVHLTAAVIDAELTVVVADDGCGLGNARRSEGLGLGMKVIAELTDSLRVINRASGGTQVEMRFQLSGARNVWDAAKMRRGAGQQRRSVPSASQPA